MKYYIIALCCLFIHTLQPTRKDHYSYSSGRKQKDKSQTHSRVFRHVDKPPWIKQIAQQKKSNFCLWSTLAMSTIACTTYFVTTALYDTSESSCNRSEF